MKSMILAAFGLALAGVANASPVMTIVHSAQSSGTITQGTTGYSIDVTLDSGGYEVSGLWLQLQSPAEVLYANAPLTMLNSPFVSDDVVVSPVAGDTVDGSSVMLFKATEGDYPGLVPQSIFRLQIDPSALAPGSYTFSPVGVELTNIDTTISTFADPGTFTLNVTAVPEPAMLGLATVSSLFFLCRRPRVGDK